VGKGKRVWYGADNGRGGKEGRIGRGRERRKEKGREGMRVERRGEEGEWRERGRMENVSTTF
jgi:hypothetical protein